MHDILVISLTMLSIAASNQVMSLIVAANRDCQEEVRVLEAAEIEARAYALHALTSLRMVRPHPRTCITVRCTLLCER